MSSYHWYIWVLRHIRVLEMLAFRIPVYAFLQTAKAQFESASPKERLDGEKCCSYTVDAGTFLLSFVKCHVNCKLMGSFSSGWIVWSSSMRRRSGMTTQVVHRALGPKQIRQLNEIYERARAVMAQYPESHIASKAAKKLIDAFEAVTHSGETALDRVWLGDATPKGTA